MYIKVSYIEASFSKKKKKNRFPVWPNLNCRLINLATGHYHVKCAKLVNLAFNSFQSVNC